MAARVVSVLLELIALYVLIHFVPKFMLVRTFQSTHNQADALELCRSLLNILIQTGLLWISTWDYELCKSSFTNRASFADLRSLVKVHMTHKYHIFPKNREKSGDSNEYISFFKKIKTF